MKVKKYFSAGARAQKVRRNSIFHRAGALLVALGFTGNVLANPTGMVVQRGNATLTINGTQLTINAGNNAVLNWQSFNIGNGETTTFNQPSAGAIVWNRIGGQSASQIYGNLNANGVVILLNSSGFYFGPNSFVSAGGLVVSTANCAPPQNSGGNWEFNGPPPLASIVNYGTIKIGNGGDCFLIAENIENHGSLEADGGNIGLAAGQTVTLSERPDGRGMSMKVTLPKGSVDNYGNLVADGGTIALNAKVVNQNGILQADSVQNKNGVIELVAADALNLGADSQILARGDNSANGSVGGNVTLKSGNNFSDVAGSSMVTAGGANGGNGGNIEVSAPNIQSLESAMDAHAQNSFRGGEFLLDPDAIFLGNGGNGSLNSSGTAAYTSGGQLNLNVNAAFLNKNFSQILLQANSDITVNANTIWDLSASTGVNHGQLTLEAGGNIIFKRGAEILDGNNWSVSLAAGYDFANNVVDGAGSIYLSGGDGLTGNGRIQTAQGNINLLAGQDILIGTGFARTSAGGSVIAQALVGNIDTGTYAHGYVYAIGSSLNAPYFKVDPIYGTGGISTAAGGNVVIVAGGDVTSFLPSGNAASSIGGDAGSGAFGSKAGNVTVVAGGNVMGHYVVANGAGRIFAGAKMDANGNPVNAGGNLIDVSDTGAHYALAAGSDGSAGTADTKLALSLVAGGWNVNAAQDIYLQEVRNPNGVFNRGQSQQSPPTYHYFNYAPDAYVNLMAGNSVTLGDSSSSLPRDVADGVEVPFIYAPILNIIAGAGGVTLTGDSDPYNKLILFPSAQGSLTIVTKGGGALSGGLAASADGSPNIFDLIVSDSGQNHYYDGNLDLFGLTDHATTPVHLDSPTPVTLDISGDMNSVLLGAPEAAQINVVGDMNNSRFQGMNLSANLSQSVQVPVREINGSLGVATVYPSLTSITVGQAAKKSMEDRGLLNRITDGGIKVGGGIQNRSEFTTVTVDASPNLAYLTQSYPPNQIAANLAKELFYKETTDPVTGIVTRQLTIQGAVNGDVLAVLQSLQIQVHDSKTGQPQFNPDGSPVLTTVAVVDAATAASLQSEYARLGPIPATRDSGYVIGGGGKFVINAQNIDLGTTIGIQSQGVGYDVVTKLDTDGNALISYPLANYFTKGADIYVNTSQNLDMFSTSITALNGSDITINSGGDINVGSSIFTGNSAAARGIFTTGLGDVAVVANGDINISGSRIAAYDGGNVTVETLNGNIDAGSGGLGFVTVSSFAVDPASRVVSAAAATIPGSGILATTLPNDPGRLVGNILVEAPNGKISAAAGGVVQLPLNNTKSPGAIVQLLAGLELHDVNGNPLMAAGIMQPTIQGDLAASAAGDLPHTVVIRNGSTPTKFQVSPTVWSQLATSLNLSPGAGQNLELNLLGGDANALQTTLSGNSSGLAHYNFATFISGDRSLDARGSGVIGSNVKLNATGDILGVIFARNNISLTSQQNVNVTALAQGTVSANAGGSLTGTLIGVGGISASGGSIDAALESNNAISGDTSGSKGIAQGTVADTASQAMSSENAAKSAASGGDAGDDGDLNNKKKKGIGLAQKVSRVTVELPGAKKLSEKTGGNDPL
jgi:filamentous hemagglutinin family protein